MERYHQVPCGRRGENQRQKSGEHSKQAASGTAGKIRKTYDDDRKDDHEG